MRQCRREFLRTTAVAASAVALGGGALAQEAAQKSRVILARNAGVTENGEVVEAVLGGMVDAAVAALTGEADAAKAWGKLFSTDETIGLKPNGLGGPLLSTATALIKACVDRLRGIGLPSERIVIWDQDPSKLIACGLEPGEMWGVRCVPANAEWDAPVQSGSFSGQITRVLTTQIDGYISLPIIKDHNLAGITGALKAHYGSISNPQAHHDNGCDPYIADLYSVPAVRNKSRLILTDGTRATCEGGPQFNPLYVWNANVLLAATDPVANDAQVWKLIEAQREAKGLPPLEIVGREPRHVKTAAERGLGNLDEAKVDVVEVGLG